MPALLAYLVALCVLLGGGYGGLYVLTHPSDAPTLAQAQPGKTSRAKSPTKKTAAEQIAASRAAAGDSEPPIDLAESTPATPAASDPPPSAAPSTDLKSETPALSPAPSDQFSAREIATAPSQAAEPGTPPASPPADAMVAMPRADATPAVAKTEEPKSVERTSRKTRLAHRHTKPVMMTLRTIEYADGRVEQRLIPLSSSAHRHVSRVDWDDDPFN